MLLIDAANYRFPFVVSIDTPGPERSLVRSRIAVLLLPHSGRPRM